MENMDVTETKNAMRRVFSSTPSITEAVKKNACSFWKPQDDILDSMHTFANDWFERRRTGVRAALETAERMCEAETPADLVREYQHWASSALQRMIFDGLACHQQFMTIAGALAQPPVSLVTETEAEASRPESKRSVPKAA